MSSDRYLFIICTCGLGRRLRQDRQDNKPVCVHTCTHVCVCMYTSHAYTYTTHVISSDRYLFVICTCKFGMRRDNAHMRMHPDVCTCEWSLARDGRWQREIDTERSSERKIENARESVQLCVGSRVTIAQSAADRSASRARRATTRNQTQRCARIRTFGCCAIDCCLLCAMTTCNATQRATNNEMYVHHF